jgi:hypothetical protein
VPGGVLVLVEPWITFASWPVYRLLHHEDCTFRVDPWHPFGSRTKDSFEGNGALSWRIVRTTSDGEWGRLGLGPPAVRTINGLAYLMSGGFKAATLLPQGLVRPVMALDRRLDRLSQWMGLRALLTWRATPSQRLPAM